MLLYLLFNCDLFNMFVFLNSLWNLSHFILYCQIYLLDSTEVDAGFSHDEKDVVILQ